MTRSLRSFFLRSTKGAAAVETALIAPIFLAIMLAVVDYGSVFYLQHTMNTVANDVSRSFALGHMTTSEATTEAQSRLPNWNSATFTVTASTPSADDVQIVITVPANEAALINFAPLGLDGDLSVTARKRKI